MQRSVNFDLQKIIAHFFLQKIFSFLFCANLNAFQTIYIHCFISFFCCRDNIVRILNICHRFIFMCSAKLYLNITLQIRYVCM
jgi:hypothetical protein